ncbi:hypothetical protein IZU99_04970 [Oscillospiraceae bacterium CM]|nr:hypothetical protein IZU99_04970 [Oscillospiraceae bacterium CM]
MGFDYGKATNDFLNTAAGARFSGKKEELEKLIDSPEGKSVQNLLSGSEGDLMNALNNGDTATLKNALSTILKTEEGVHLAEQILKMMK